MAAESPKRGSKPTGYGLTVRPLPVSDNSTFETVINFLTDIVQQPSSSNIDDREKIMWMKFAYADLNENIASDHKSMRFDGSTSPLILILGVAHGVQVWTISANGDAQEILSWHQGPVKTFVILPTPVPLGSGQDIFFSKRPIAAMCDSFSQGQPFCTANFVSLRYGEVVHSIKFKNPICNIYCNKKVIVITFHEKIAVFDACTFKDRFTISNCYLSSGSNLNPVALGSNWLAYADQKLVSKHQTRGGVAGSEDNSMVVYAAKSFTRIGESVVYSLTGNRRNAAQKEETGNQTQYGIVTIVDVAKVGEGEVNFSEENVSGIIAHFVAHVNGPIAALQFDHSGVLLATADCAGHRFHIFRIFPHPSSTSIGAVHHLYTLNRGQTTATVQYMTFSLDSRWIAVSSLRGTTHVYPITPYGGPVTARTHMSPRVVNRLSRFHKSAGLEDLHHNTGRSSPNLTNSPSSGLGILGSCSGSRTYDSYPALHNPNSCRMGNPRLGPYPHPIIVSPLAKIKQTSSASSFAYGGETRSPLMKGSSVHKLSSDGEQVATVFGSQRSWYSGSPGIIKDKEKKNSDCLYIAGSRGEIIEYVLELKSRSSTGKQNDDSSIDLEVNANARWVIQRPHNSPEVKLPLSSVNPLIIAQDSRRSPNNPLSATANTKSLSTCSNLSDLKPEERWLSQVEIITYAGPHRRIWQGPQFTFVTYQQPANTTILSANSSALLGQGPDSISASMVGGHFLEDYGSESLSSRTAARSIPMAMPGGTKHKAPLIEAGSFDQNQGILEVYGYSWPDSLPSGSSSGGSSHHHHSGAGGLSHHFHLDDRPTEDQLRECLADAMLESPSRPQCGGASSGNWSAVRIAPGESSLIASGRPIGGMGGNSEDLQTWDENLDGSSEELSTSSSHSGSASQMSDAPLHSMDHLIGFPGTTTPPSSPDVLLGGSDILHS